MKQKFYVTTAIDYVNAEPHIGHAYQKIVADVLARWHRLIGEDVFFLTGTDEHGKKVAESAEKAGKSPEEFSNEISKKFQEAWSSLNVQPNRFIRTTDKDHEKTVHEITKKINEKGDIYKSEYEGLYCTGCEAYYTEKDAPELICPIHKKPLEKLKEESYFFRLSRYQNFLLEHYKKHPEFILPESRRNEVVNRVKEGLKDLSITRSSLTWGIPFTLDKQHVFYVWYEALINYYTGINSAKLKKYWPANAHILGKDNTWFHAVIWPAILKSADIKLPISTLNHGFLSFNGEKISKSLGNAISPKYLVEKYGVDTIRYFSLRHFPFATGEDGNFDEPALIDRHNNELANKLGNLISRVSALAEKYGLEKSEIKELNSQDLVKKVEKHFENYELDKALNEIFAFIDRCNEFIQNKKPWEVRSPQGVDEERGSSSKSESNSNTILYELSNAIKDFTILLYPFIPETAKKISKTFNFKIDIKEIGKPLTIKPIKKSEILFKKI
jgi:methionyl-tRNA synthetase